jgi:hypothetical protein
MLGGAIATKRPRSASSMKLQDSILACPHLFVCKCGQHGQMYVHAIKQPGVNAFAPSSRAVPSSPATVSFSSSSPTTTSSSCIHADAVVNGAHIDDASSSIEQHDADAETYLSAAHRYLLTNGHTSKYTCINLNRLCAVPSILKHKPFKCFKASDAFKLDSKRFCILSVNSGVEVYAVAPSSGEGNRKRVQTNADDSLEKKRKL